MDYCSTRASDHRQSDAQAIVAGLSPDGGLFVPTEIPALSLAEITALRDLPYAGRAAAVMARFLPSFSPGELADYAGRAYALARFPVSGTAPVVRLDETAYSLELFHGPTCAFKDFALQMLPHLLTASLRKTGVEDTVMILVATSGDTGKAALEGFADVEGTGICVFFPDGGTSPMQRIQMTTQTGRNVMVAAVAGNFDDAQNGVKALFADKAYGEALGARGVRLSSANSINWGRLVPQIAYYVSAYCDLLSAGVLQAGAPMNVCVPTGNFGNILAAWFAKRMGTPIAKFLCASNRNNVLTDFLRTGVYDRHRPFHMTTSPSMDILISSNLERLLYLLDPDAAAVRGYMQSLAQNGKYRVSDALFDRLRAEFDCGFCDDEQAAAVIRRTFDAGYLADPHTAVGIDVYETYRTRTGDATPTLIAATASPFKFCPSVLEALGKPATGDDFAMLEALGALSGQTPPAQLSGLRGKTERFKAVVEPAQMGAVVADFIQEAVAL